VANEISSLIRRIVLWLVLLFLGYIFYKIWIGKKIGKGTKILGWIVSIFFILGALLLLVVGIYGFQKSPLVVLLIIPIIGLVGMSIIIILYLTVKVTPVITKTKVYRGSTDAVIRACKGALEKSGFRIINIDTTFKEIIASYDVKWNTLGFNIKVKVAETTRGVLVSITSEARSKLDLRNTKKNEKNILDFFTNLDSILR